MQLVFKALAHPNKMALGSSYNASYKHIFSFTCIASFMTITQVDVSYPACLRNVVVNGPIRHDWVACSARTTRSQLSAGHKMRTIQTADQIIAYRLKALKLEG